MNTSEKMKLYGLNSMSNEELARIAYNLDHEQAEAYISYVSDVASAATGELTQIKGIGAKTAERITASVELAKRIEAYKACRTSERIDDSRKVADMLRRRIGTENREHFIAIGLDSKLKIKFVETVAIGNLDSAPVHPREVFNKAIKESAAAVIVAHNHPSGDPTPSRQDIEATERLKNASDIIGIKLLDHVIVGAHSFTSLKSEGYL